MDLAHAVGCVLADILTVAMDYFMWQLFYSLATKRLLEVPVPIFHYHYAFSDMFMSAIVLCVHMKLSIETEYIYCNAKLLLYF